MTEIEILTRQLPRSVHIAAIEAGIAYVEARNEEGFTDEQLSALRKHGREGKHSSLYMTDRTVPADCMCPLATLGIYHSEVDDDGNEVELFECGVETGWAFIGGHDDFLYDHFQGSNSFTVFDIVDDHA